MNNQQLKLYNDMLMSMRLLTNSLSPKAEKQKKLAYFINSIISKCEQKQNEYVPDDYLITVKRGKFKLFF